jgi:predicted regulator of amino acid metabolism with ACT domain
VQTTKLIFLAVPILLSGCAAPLFLTGLGVGSVAVTETTGKTITDNTVSAVSGQDCRVSRVFKSQTVCQDEVPQSKFQVVTTKVTPSSVEEIESKYK